MSSADLLRMFSTAGKVICLQISGLMSIQLMRTRLMNALMWVRMPRMERLFVLCALTLVSPGEGGGLTLPPASSLLEEKILDFAQMS